MSTTWGEFNAFTMGDEVVSAFAPYVRGRIFLITGPTPSSIGGALASSLAKGGPDVLVLAGRSPDKFASVVDEIKSIDFGIKVVVVAVDLASQKSVRAAAQSILDNPDVPMIDVMFNNAGISNVPCAFLPRNCLPVPNA